MAESKLNDIIGTSLEKIKALADGETVIGSPITTPGGTTVIPVSKVSLGFASGGSDLPTRTAKEYFAGGAGAGMSVKPVGFLVIQNGDVRLIQLSMSADKGNVALNMVPDIIDKISGIISKKDKNAAQSTAQETVQDAVQDVTESV